MKGAYLSTIEERRYMERLLEENEGEKGDRSAVTRRYTTTDDAPRIRYHSEPRKHLPKKDWTRSFVTVVYQRVTLLEVVAERKGK
jgi:hypothetical protein